MVNMSDLIPSHPLFYVKLTTINPSYFNDDNVLDIQQSYLEEWNGDQLLTGVPLDYNYPYAIHVVFKYDVDQSYINSLQSIYNYSTITYQIGY